MPARWRKDQSRCSRSRSSAEHGAQISSPRWTAKARTKAACETVRSIFKSHRRVDPIDIEDHCCTGWQLVTAKRRSTLLVDERTLRVYVAARRAVLVPREAFVGATYAPGEQSQFDFSPMSVMVAGVVVVVQLFVVRLS